MSYSLWGQKKSDTTKRLNTHTRIFFGKLAIQILGPFFNLVACFFLLLSFESSLYILDNSPLSDVSFANTFSKSMLISSFS